MMRRLLYKLLLHAYPRQMRHEFGRDMELAFTSLCAEQRGRPRALATIYCRETVDAMRSGLSQRRSLQSHAEPPWLPADRGGSWMQSLFQDLRFAARSLIKKPGFSLVAVVTLALGVGATTLIFSVTDAVLFRALPYAAPEQLVMLGSELGRSGRMSAMTTLDFLDFRDRATSFAAVAASASATLDVTGEGAPQRLRGARVSADFFRVLGVEPLHGRAFTRDEEQPGNDRVVVVTHDVWQVRWGGDPAAVGRTVSLNGVPFMLVGVMPPDFQPPEGIRYQPEVDAWIPLALDRNDDGAVNRFTSFLWVIGRLDEGVSMEAAGDEIEALSAAFHSEFYVTGQNEFAFRMESLFERTVGPIGATLWVLMGAVGFLLLIACANVANLSFARGSDRRQEIAMRTALGAGQGRMIQQLLMESVLLALAGGALGAVLAFGGVQALPLVDPGRIPRLAEVAVNLRVLSFALVLSVVTGVLFGIGPALRVSRANVSQILKEGAQQSAGNVRDRLRNSLVVAQTALALMLLIGAGLLINSFVRLVNVDPGFDADGLISMSLYIPPEPGSTGSRWAPSYEGEDQYWNTFYADVLARVEAIPGVTAAAGTTSPPIVGGEIWMAVAIEGREADPENPNYQADNRVSPGYFKAIGTRLLRGREFTAADADPSFSGVVINESFADRYWPHEDPMGRRFQYGTLPDPDGDFLDVIGVVEDTKQGALIDASTPEFFVPFLTAPMRAMTVLARYEGGAGEVAEGLRAAVWEIDADLPIGRLETMDVTISGSVVQPRFYTLLLTVFGSVAMVLAAVGTYGTMAYSVGRRSREVGVRMALGAGPGSVLGLIVGQGMKVTAIGIVLGVGGALALSRFIEGFVFGVTPTDPATFAAVAGVLALVSLLACYVPARRAAKLDPALTLRSD